ncbi:MAG TPA: CBS domain-containing protein [Acidisoma sp.]|jgi:CBS domain-containing protein|nr:CBS domain-containing protein [Acidisoma sp.]
MATTIQQVLNQKGWGVAVLTKHQTIPDVAKFLTANRIGAAPVVDELGAIAGMLSERDIMRFVGEFGGEILHKTAEDLMTKLVAHCSPDDTILDAMQLMTSRRCRHLPVLVDGTLKGLISIGDVVKAQIEEARFEVDSMRTYITTA